MMLDLALFDSVGIAGCFQCGRTVEVREVVPRQMPLKRLNFSATVYISNASVPCGSRIGSALSRNSIISVEAWNGRRGVNSFRIFYPKPVALESQTEKWAHEAGN